MPKLRLFRDPAPVALGVILAIALILRLMSLQGESFWLDEAYSFYQARNPFLFSPDNPFHLVKFTSRLAFIRHILADDIHPPFYYGQLALWSQISTSDIWMRANSILWGMLTIPATYGFAKKLVASPFRTGTPSGNSLGNQSDLPLIKESIFSSEIVGLISAALVAFSPFFVEMSVELRMYGLMAFLAVVSASSFYTILHSSQPTPKDWLIYTLANLLFIYSQGIGFLWFGIQIALYASIFAPPWLKQRTVPATLKPWLWSQAIALFTFLPWAMLVITMSGRIRGANYLRVPNLLDLVSVPGQLLFNNAASFSYPSPPLPTFPPLLWGLWAGTGVLVAIALYSLRDRRLVFWVLTVPSIGALGIFYGVSLLVRPIFILRALSFTLPFFAVLVAIGLVTVVQRSFLQPRLRTSLLIGMLAGLIGINFYGIHDGVVTANRTQWREMGTFLSQQVQPRDVVVVPYSSAGEFLLYNSVPRDQYNGELIEQLRLYWREPANFIKVWGPDYDGFLRSHQLDYQKSVRLLLLTENLEQVLSVQNLPVQNPAGQRDRLPHSRVWLVTSPGRTGNELTQYQTQLAKTKTLKTTTQFFRATVMQYE
jgi:hypothetical protein